MVTALQRQRTADHLHAIADIYDMLGETFRAGAYSRGAELVLQKGVIEDIINGDKVKGIGDKLKLVIKSFIDTGSSAQMRKLIALPKYKAYTALSKVLGAGPAQIEQWYRHGISTLAQLRAAARSGSITLTKSQEVGLKYVNELNTRLPRRLVTSIGKAITTIIHKWNARADVVIAGSYRRGLSTSGDVDIVCSVANADAKKLAAELREHPSCVYVLSSGEQKVSLIWRDSSNHAARVDIAICAPVDFVPTLLYFTGSWDFNERMRGIARKQGYKLNQFGLWRVSAGKPDQKIKVDTEKDIFARLGIKYLPPASRTSESIKMV